jgi:hypothetical protein
MVAQYLALVNGHVPQDSYEINGDLVMGRFLRCRKRRNEQCRAPHAVAPRVLSCDKPFTQMTIAGVLAQIPQEFLSVGVQLSFPRGVLKNELFDDQRIATPEQLRPQQQLRLNELGLRSRDRIVARANGQTAHICFDGTGTNER